MASVIQNGEIFNQNDWGPKSGKGSAFDFWEALLNQRFCIAGGVLDGFEAQGSPNVINAAFALERLDLFVETAIEGLGGDVRKILPFLLLQGPQVSSVPERGDILR